MSHFGGGAPGSFQMPAAPFLKPPLGGVGSKLPTPGTLPASIAAAARKQLATRHTTVYVGKIAPTVDDDFIKSLLGCCGTVKSWKRVQDPATKKPKGFGFCEFEEPEGVAVALEVLGGLSLDGQDLLINANEATQTFVQDQKHWKAEERRAAKIAGGGGAKEPAGAGVALEAAPQPAGEEVGGLAEFVAEIEKENSDMAAGAKEKVESMLKGRAPVPPGPPPGPPPGGLVGAGPSDAKAMASSFLSSFKEEGEVAAALPIPPPPPPMDKQKMAEMEEERRKKREKDRERERERAREREKERSERDQKDRERVEERQVKDRERQTEQRQVKREREREREREKEAKAERERAQLVQDDEDAAEADGPHWQARRREGRAAEDRRRRRKRELEEDEADRAAEAREVEEAKAAEEAALRAALEAAAARASQGASGESAAADPDGGAADAAEEAMEVDERPPSPISMAMAQAAALESGSTAKKSAEPPSKVGFGLAAGKAGRKAAAPRAFNVVEEEERDTRERVLVPIEYTDAERRAIETAEGGQAARGDLKSLVSSVPTGRDEVFAHPIRWDVIDKIKETVGGWVRKKVSELLGDDASAMDLVEFVAGNVSRHCTAAEMLRELEPVLDSEAEGFVVKLWTMLIYEGLKAQRS